MNVTIFDTNRVRSYGVEQVLNAAGCRVAALTPDDNQEALSAAWADADIVITEIVHLTTHLSNFFQAAGRDGKLPIVALWKDAKRAPTFRYSAFNIRAILDPGCTVEELQHFIEFAKAGQLSKLVEDTKKVQPLPIRPILSTREMQVASLIAKGCKNRAIAASLEISEQTVKNHLHNIFVKIRVTNRLDLAILINNNPSLHASGVWSTD